MRTKLIPVMVSTLKMRQQYEVSKETKVQIAMRTIPKPVIVGTLEKRQKHEGLKVTTLTRMAAQRRQKRHHMYYSLNSLKGGYIGDYIGDYYRGY